MTDADVATLLGDRLNELEPGVEQHWSIRESTPLRVHFDVSFGDVAPRRSGQPAIAAAKQPFGFARALADVQNASY